MAYPHKSQKIAETIASWFAEKKYRPGDRFPSDQELAKQFGVNHVTVRTALKRFVDSGHLERRVGSGTIVREPGQNDHAGGTINLGVGLSIPDATHSFFGEMLRAAEGALHGTGRPLLLGHTWELGEREEQVVNNWVAQGVTHMILTPPVSDPRFYNSLLDRGIRFVFVDRRVEGVNVPSIVSRDEAGMSSVVRYLIDLGHRTLLHLAGPATIWTARERRNSFERSSAAGGLRPDELRVIQCGYYIDDGYAAMTEWLAHNPPPEAIVAANDPVAIGAIRALQEKGFQVPEDVTVSGYGDTDLGRNFGLTTVRQFSDRMGTEAIRLVLGAQPLSVRDSVEITPELVVRTSTTSPRRRSKAAG